MKPTEGNGSGFGGGQKIGPYIAACTWKLMVTFNFRCILEDMVFEQFFLGFPKKRMVESSVSKSHRDKS